MSKEEIIKYALEIMGKGMFSIFVVILILMLIVVLLTKVTNMWIIQNFYSSLFTSSLLPFKVSATQKRSLLYTFHQAIRLPFL